MRRRPADLSGRLRFAKGKARRAGLDALLVDDQSDIIYFTGFSCPGAFLLVPRKGRSLFFVDRMNFTLAEKTLKDVDLDIVPGHAIRETAFALEDNKWRKVGIKESTLTVASQKNLERLTPSVKLKPSGIPAELRVKKDPSEISILRKAAKETVRIWERASKKIKTGMTEKEIATLVDLEVRKAGCGNSFPTIAAIGTNSAFPHAIPSARRLKKGEHVLVDFGIKYNNYCSDLTRTWDNGRINRKIGYLRDIVQAAQKDAIRVMKAGVSIASLARKMTRFFKENGLGEHIKHGLGHGLGIDVHEAPALCEASNVKMEAGMVVTVEPGLYVPGTGGIREEDTVLIKKDGCEVLSR